MTVSETESSSHSMPSMSHNESGHRVDISGLLCMCTPTAWSAVSITAPDLRSLVSVLIALAVLLLLLLHLSVDLSQCVCVCVMCARSIIIISFPSRSSPVEYSAGVKVSRNAPERRSGARKSLRLQSYRISHFHNRNHTFLGPASQQLSL